MGHKKQDVICVRGEGMIVQRGNATALHCYCVSLSVCFVVCSVAECDVVWHSVAHRGVAQRGVALGVA